MNQPDTRFINEGKPDVDTPCDWLGFCGYGEAVMRLQAQTYCRCCQAISALPWWHRRRFVNPQLVPGFYGARDMLYFHRSDYMCAEISWPHRLAFPNTNLRCDFGALDHLTKC